MSYSDVTNASAESTSKKRTHQIDEPALLFLVGLWFHLEQDDDQSEECERLDQREAKDQEDNQAAASAGVARQCFASRSRCLALTESAKTSRDCHAYTTSDFDAPSRCSGLKARIYDDIKHLNSIGIRITGENPPWPRSPVQTRSKGDQPRAELAENRTR